MVQEHPINYEDKKANSLNKENHKCKKLTPTIKTYKYDDWIKVF